MDKEFEGVDLDALTPAQESAHEVVQEVPGGLRDIVVTSAPKVSVFGAQSSNTSLDLSNLKLLYLFDESLSMRRHINNDQSKLDMVKKAALAFIQKHFAVWPNAFVSIWGFTEQLYKRVTWGTLPEILSAVGNLYAHDVTRITQAVAAAVLELKQHPSPTKQNHIVLVSDGMDESADEVELSLMETMIQNNIVFDFIYIAPRSIPGFDFDIPRPVIDSLKRVCERTGGSFVTCFDVVTFEKKFLMLSERPCLPAPREV